MRAPKLRELKEAITALIKGPYTAKFPAAPAIIADKFRGAPRYDEEKCVGCGGCANVCPTGACEMEDDVEARVRRMTIRFDRCIFCGQCELNCLTEEGVKQGKEFDLATLDRSQLRETCEKALLFCESCGAVVGTEDHVRWVARRLGPVAFANPTLLLKSMGDMDLADKEPPPSTDLRRGDRLRILCPKCRQVTGLMA